MKKFFLFAAIGFSAVGFHTTTARADDIPPVPASDNGVPGDGYDSARYEALWTKSPFAVETPEAAPDSPDFMLVGVASVDGVSYASVIDKKTQQHFLVSTDKASDGLTLTSITPAHDGIDTTAVVQKDGAPITPTLQPEPAGPGGAPGVAAINAPVPQPMPGAALQIPMPGSTVDNVPHRPMIPRFHRPPIHLPPVPGASPPPGQQPATSDQPVPPPPQ